MSEVTEGLPARVVTATTAAERMGVAAVLLEAIVPGAGHLLVRRIARGLLFLLACTGPVLALALLIRGNVWMVVELLANAWFIWVLLAGLCVIALLRPLAVLLVGRAAGVRGRAALAAGLTTTCLLWLPYVLVGQYAWDSHVAFAKVFDGARSDESWPLGAPTPTVVTARPVRSLASIGSLSETKRQRVNILLIGGDAGWDRWGLRADTLIVLSLNAENGRAAVFGIPRNLKPVPLYGAAGRRDGSFGDLINALYQYGQNNPSLFPGARDKGAAALMESISGMLAIPIDYFALVDLRGFVEMVDALGGVDVVALDSLKDRVSPPYRGESWIPIQVTRGREYHLTGRKALAYARSRWQSSDYTRMRRQRCLLNSLAENVSIAQMLRTYPKIIGALGRYARTDVPPGRLPDLYELIANIDRKRSVAVSLGPPLYSRGDRPDIAAMRDIVRRALAGKASGVGRARALSSECSAATG